MICLRIRFSWFGRASFGLNKQTAKTNRFQPSIAFESSSEISKTALEEFDQSVIKLRSFGIDVTVFQDSKKPEKPDAVFPNNWISTHPSGEVVVYPMLTENRRIEVREDVIQALNGERFMDLRETENEVLEGTGSVVVDHEAKKIYFCYSDRTQESMVMKLARILKFTVCGFHSVDHQNNLIYHTNVVMFVMHGYIGIGLETIKDPLEKQKVISSIEASGKKVLDLSYYQITQFAGNMLQIHSVNNGLVLVCSETAWKSLEEKQKRVLEQVSRVCVISIPTIEFYGGGSARCMIAENYI